MRATWRDQEQPTVRQSARIVAAVAILESIKERLADGEQIAVINRSEYLVYVLPEKDLPHGHWFIQRLGSLVLVSEDEAARTTAVASFTELRVALSHADQITA